MIKNPLSLNKDVVHISTVAQIDTRVVHYFLRKLNIDLEASDLKVLISDNTSINRKAVSFFAKPAGLSIVYQHPADPSRPLFFSSCFRPGSLTEVH
ncbi:hypothetical protein HPB48_015707 [Haemaphysalis longicornis]|uniref:Uncharacterized protein n=1 Tax=Haemaphysalis longicornis TaxID=44386 RepID=A0A9J6FAU2_HAELO|nr:hypothetical protein HPB48_015707 [Haemaphysalis longicornis]